MRKIKELDLSSKKYIIFDLDGTLIDSIGIWNVTDYRLIKMLGNKEIDLGVIQKDRDNFLENNTGSDIYLEYCQFLIDKYGLNISKEKFFELRFNISNEFLASELDFKPDAVEVIKRLKELGFVLVLATATTKTQLDVYSNKNELMYNQLKISEWFDLIITKDDVKYKKPNPEIYLYILKYFNTDTESCLVFEDSLHGVMASKSALIETINVYDKYSDDDRCKLNTLSDYSITCYKEFLDSVLSKSEGRCKKKKHQ